VPSDPLEALAPGLPSGHGRAGGVHLRQVPSFSNASVLGNELQEVAMRIRISLGVPIVVALAVAAVAAGGADAKTGPCATGQLVKSGSYVFALDLGSVETMYTPAEVKAKHPKSGEVMLSGSMTGGMAGMTMSSSGERHLEVHICTSGGAVYTKGHPTITIDDSTSKNPMMMVPVATMEGIGEGISDFHYGNNVELTTGHHITVTVTLNGRSAVFHTTVPKSAMSMG
jgi:hypothetical protein